MSVDIGSLGALLRPPRLEPVSKAGGASTSPLGNSFAYRGSSLTKIQKSGLTNLESYIQGNVKGDDATKLMRQVASLCMCMEMTNATSPKRSSAYDMVSGVFGAGDNRSLPLGTFYNQLL